ncbi:hypothetical protein ACFYKT_02170 [Cytobacillus sp. FJAT-53684]|uniref:RNA polymerase subunit sigma n=1 Tax=Cytobacillus mangrovibacter TaxID=3299024 RepID=A0ABW6JTH9_9BACI
MSLKSIEMQVALPRSVEAGKIQEQLQQRGHHKNEITTQKSQKEDEVKRKTVIKQEQKGNVNFSKEKKDHQHDSSKQQGHNGSAEEVIIEKKEKHPYKGKIIDFSG